MSDAMTKNEEAFLAWAPDEDVWTSWAKPVLFSSLELASQNIFENIEPMAGVEGFSNPGNRVVVVDLPGADSVKAALALLGSGYRPVPLYNGCQGPSPVVSMRELLDAVKVATDIVKGSGLPLHAPPAFLLDSKRMSGFPSSGNFDNRWLVFPQDFPSGKFLLSKRFVEVVLISSPDGVVQEDLSHILLRWKEEGISVKYLSLISKQVNELNVPRSAQYKLFFYRALAKIGLRPNSAGGFGDVIPVPSETSYGGYG